MAAKKTSKKITAAAAGTAINVGRRMLFGNVITADFFRRHWMKLFILMTLVMIYISTKYQCMTCMEQIQTLETELAVAKTERIRERSTYMSRIRESAMQELADSILPGLAVQQQPPYTLPR